MLVLRWLAAVFAFLAMLAIVAAGVLFSLDYGAVKDDLSGWLSARIGRAVAVDGALSISPGRTLRLTVEGLRLANADWGSRPDMLLAERVLVEVDAWSLIDRPVIIRRIEVDGFDLLLERTADGSNNWEFGGREEPQDFGWLESLPVVLDDVTLPGARLQFNGPRLDRPLDILFDRLEQRRLDDGWLALVGTGRANEVGLSLRARAGPFDALVAGRNFEAALDGEIGELRLTSRVRIDRLDQPVDTEMDLRLQAPDADYLASRLGVRNLGAGPVALSASVVQAPEGQGVQGSLSGSLGGFSIEARTQVTDPSEMQHLGLQLDVAGPDLSLLGGVAGIDRLPAESFHLRARVERSDQQLTIDGMDLELRDSKLHLHGSVSRLSEMSGTDVDFRFTGSDVAQFRKLLGVSGIASGPFTFAGRARRGENGEEWLEVESRTALGRLSVSGPLGPYPDYYGTRLRFSADGTDLARVGAAAGIGNLPGGSFTASGAFEWTRKGVVFSDSSLGTGAERLEIDGRVGRKPLGPDTDLRFAVAGRDLRRLARALAIEGAPAADYSLQGRLQRERNGSRLRDLRGAIGGANLRLRGRIADEPRRGGADVNFTVSGPALQVFATWLPGYELPKGPFSASGGLKLASDAAVLRDLRLEAAGAQARLDADIRLPLGDAEGDFDLVAKGPDLAAFLPDLGSARPLARSFDLMAKGRARNGRWNFERMQLATGAGNLVVSGDLDWAPDFSATNLRLDIDLPDLAVAGRLMGLDLPAQPLKLAAGFSGTPTAFRMQQITGRLGPSDFSGELSLAPGKRPEVEAAIRSQLLDLSSIGAGDPAPPAAAPSARARLIPDTPLQLGWIGAIDGRFDVTAAQARIGTVAVQDLRLTARLREGGLFVDPLEMRGPFGGQFAIRGQLVPAPAGANAELAVTARQMILSRWTDPPEQALKRPTADLDLQLTGRGQTWRELAGSLDGRIRLVGGAGEAPAAGLERLFGNFWRSLVRNVGGKDAPTNLKLRCLALVSNVAKGVAVTAPVLAFQTDNVNVITHGTVDLGDETVELYLRTTPRKAIGISAGEIINPYVKIAGPLRDPGLVVDAKGTLFSAGTAFATAGLSIVAKSLWDRMFRAEDPCAAALKEADRLAAQPASTKPRWVPELLRR